MIQILKAAVLTCMKGFLVTCTCLYILLQPSILFAEPILLLLDIDDKQTTALDASKGPSIAYAPNLKLLEQLYKGKVGELYLPVGTSILLFKQKEQYIRNQIVTWKGSDTSGNVQMLFTIGIDHLYGRVNTGLDIFVYASDPRTGDILVKQLDPANEVELDNDYLLVPDRRFPVQDVVPAYDVDDGSRIDVMVLYTNGMASAHPGSAINTRIQFLIDQGNQSFDNSDINTQFNLIHTQEVIYPDDSSGNMHEALDDLTNNNGVFTNVEALRTTHGADQVVLLRRFVDEGCGLAWLLTAPSARYAYAVVHDGSKTDGSGYYCSDLTYTHEIGHNLGCHHDRANAGSSARYSYSYGYQDPGGSFRTVMSYNCPEGCLRVPHFSNPDVSYGVQPTGIDHTAPDSANNALTINQTRIEMAAYRQEVAVDVVVTPLAGANGSISPSTSQTINYGHTTSFTINPDDNYHIDTVTGCSGTLFGNTYTTGPVTADCTITASFAIDTHIVTPSVGANGDISPSTPQTINQGTTTSFNITPNASYHINTVTGCSGTLFGNTYTTGPVTADCTVTASFAIDTHSVTPAAGVNGGISPSTSQTVDHGATTSFTITPDANYRINTVTGCSGTLEGNTYTTGPVTANCTVTASLAIDTYSVIPSAGVNGSISPPTKQTVNHGATTSFIISPDTNYHIYTVSGCSGTLSGNTYTTNPVTADCAVTASFAIDTHTVTPSAGANGDISPSIPQTINHDATASFNINPDIGYHVSNVTGTCDGILSGNTFTTDPVASNCTVNAVFTLNAYTVTPFAEGDGSIAPPAPQTINHGSTTTFTVTPDEGYTSFVSGTCGGILDVTTYTTNTIISDCTAIANFGINMYLVNTPEGQHATIYPYGEIFVNHGEILTFTLTPDDDYKISEVTGCDGTLTENVYTTDDITGSCEITVTFAKDSFPWTMFLPAILSAQPHH